MLNFYKLKGLVRYDKSNSQFLNPLSGGVNNSTGMLIKTTEHFLPSMVTVLTCSTV